MLGYGQEEELWVVLEEDGTEVRNFFKIHPWESSVPHSTMGETGARIDCELLVDFLQNKKPQISQLPTFAGFCHQC